MQPIQQLVDLNGKVAVVTGAAAGIGRAIAVRLHEAGARLALVDVDAEGLGSLAYELNEKRPESTITLAGDVSSGEVIERLRSQTLDAFGQVDVLVNNAGIFPNQPLRDMTENDFQRVVDVNLKSVFLTTKYISESMKERGEGGKIINVTSIDALHPSMVGLAHYDASKHGVWGFTKNAALELAEHNIWVNAVAPGGVDTSGVAAMSEAGELPEQVKAFIDTIPMKRMGDPDEIAKVVLFLASDLSSYMTGSQVVVDGGKLLA